MIGDPSGRSTERSMLCQSVLEQNLQLIEQQISRIFENHEKYFWSKRIDAEALKPLR